MLSVCASSSSSTTEGVRKARSPKSPLSLIAVASGMTALLLIVAVLQFRWTTQLNEAAEVRIGSSLQSSMMAWNLDFYGELSAICVALQVGPDSGARDSWDDYLQRYAEWSARNVPESVENIYKNPDLVESVYIWETTRAAKPRLLRLRPDSKTFENSKVSQGLGPLLGRLREDSSSLPLALNAWRFRDPSSLRSSGGSERFSPLHLLRSNAITGWQFDANVPAIVHPILHPTGHRMSTGRQAPSIQNPVDWIVVVLNLNTIQRRILPDLAKRYFYKGEGLEYKLAVIAVGPTPRLIYSSDPGFADHSVTASDSTMNIFGPPPESVEGHFWEGVKNSQSARSQEWHRFAGPVWFPVVQYTPQAEPWMLVLKHRSGSLEATVANVRRRNLMAGGLVLLLLAAAMSLLVIASQRAQRLVQLQLDFVASVSHELLTPLAALYSTGQNIRDGLIEGKSDLMVHGSIITSQTHQLMDLVSQILLFASTENGRSRYVLRPLQVTEIIQCVLKNVAVLAQERRFYIEQHVPAGLPCVMGDLSALSHCLQNLIVNAIKYGGKQRWIGIYAELDAAETPDEIRISVQDHGVGIDSLELSHVFEPFYRSPKVAAQIHGTGLGLAVARRIAEALGGQLTVTSDLGVGSSFTLHLPVATELATTKRRVGDQREFGEQR
jgi:signal transduction histidine kinase